MKKLFLVLFTALCCFGLFAEEPIPVWVMDAADGNVKTAVKQAGINTDENMVYILKNSQKEGEHFDLHKYMMITAFGEVIEPSIYQTVAEHYNKETNTVVTSRTTSSGFKMSTYVFGGKRKISEFYEDPETGLIFPLMDASEDGRVIHGECLDDILTCLKKNSLFQEMNIAAEYYIFKDVPKTKKNKKKNIAATAPVIVDYGPDFKTEKKYSSCDGFCIVTFPKALFNQIVMELMETIN